MQNIASTVENSAYWFGLDVLSEKLAKVANKTPLAIYRKLCITNYWPSSLQTIVRKETNFIGKNKDLVKTLKEQKRDLLKLLVFLTDFCKGKSTDDIKEIIEQRKLLTEKEMEECKLEQNYDRVALAYKVFQKSPENLKQLYWWTRIQSRDFDAYSLNIEASELFAHFNPTTQGFQTQLDNFFKNDCYCWNIFLDSEVKTYCMRAFPSDRIIHHVKNNTQGSFAGTYILRVHSNGEIQVPEGGKSKTLKIATAFAREIYGKKTKFSRKLSHSKLSDLEVFAKNILSEQTAGIKIVELELNRAPIVGSPTVRFLKNDGLLETINGLGRLGIDLQKEANNISEIVVLTSGKKRKIHFDRESSREIVANCRNRHLSLNEKNLIQNYFAKFGISVNFGSGKI